MYVCMYADTHIFPPLQARTRRRARSYTDIMQALRVYRQVLPTQLVHNRLVLCQCPELLTSLAAAGGVVAHRCRSVVSPSLPGARVHVACPIDFAVPALA